MELFIIFLNLFVYSILVTTQNILTFLICYGLFFIMFIIFIIFIIPALSVCIRRFHDIGLSGKWASFLLICSLAVFVYVQYTKMVDLPVLTNNNTPEALPDGAILRFFITWILSLLSVITSFMLIYFMQIKGMVTTNSYGEPPHSLE